jgi:hypothetical protein
MKQGQKVVCIEGRKKEVQSQGTVVQISHKRILVRINGVLKWLHPDRVKTPK